MSLNYFEVRYAVAYKIFLLSFIVARASMLKIFTSLAVS